MFTGKNPASRTSGWPPVPRVLQAIIFITLLCSVAAAQTYNATFLVSDIPAAATHTDKKLVNPWGLVSTPASPWWVSDNGSGFSTLYDGAGNPQSLIVKIPSANGMGTGTPTGVVFNGTPDFELSKNNPAIFIFATEDGTISGWNPNVQATRAEIKVNNSSEKAVYKGLALATHNGKNFLYAANFGLGTVDVFDFHFAPHSFGSDAFVDPSIPSGYAPFNIQSVGDVLVVTYAKQDAAHHDDVAGAGHGFVRIFDTHGVLQATFQHVAALNSPWGVAWAPSHFGKFSGDLLIGQFGSGAIAAFGLDGTFKGLVRDSSGLALRINGLWALRFGNDAAAGPSTTLFFTAGVFDESHGLFGTITPQP